MQSRQKTLQSRIDEVTAYLSPFLHIANVHMVEYYTENHWELLPTSLREYLCKTSVDNAMNEFWNSCNSENSGETTTSPLNDFIYKARNCHLKVDEEICLSLNNIEVKLQEMGGQYGREIQLKEFMCPKKSYEVSVMTSLAGRVLSACGARCCVELGGGKGYLASALSLACNARCLCVDCDTVALEGARRIQRLRQRHTKNIIRTQQNAIPISNEDSEREEKNKNDLLKFDCLYIDQSTDLCELVKRNFGELCDADDIRLMVTGLHTCGDLGPSTLRIFAGDASVRAVCSVPCCYHLLTEAADFSAHWALEEAGSTLDTSGFPMSEYLRGYQLGRNARMLASQSLERVVAARDEPSVGLHYRAMLQVVIRNVLKTEVPTDRLKGISKRSNNFTDYFKMAANKLQLHQLSDAQLSDEYLSDFERGFEPKLKELRLFYLARLCLAQVIENLILLDRLQYLCENGYEKCWLVKLFEPEISPRCACIVCVK